MRVQHHDIPARDGTLTRYAEVVIVGALVTQLTAGEKTELRRRVERPVLLQAPDIEAAIIILGIGGATASALAAAFLVPRGDGAVAPAVAGPGRQPAG